MAAIDGFEFHRAALGLYAFVYDDLCDWYLELLKPRLYADDNRDAAALALHVLGETLTLAHPSSRSSPRRSGASFRVPKAS